jgi:hypothetical protein
MQTATASATFTPATRVVIDDLCKDLTRRIQRTVKADYGQTDCGRVHDAALCVESLPAGSWGHPGRLVSILAGPGVAGGFVVLGADGAPVAEGVGLGHAVTAARLSGVRSYRKIAKTA